MAEITDYVGAIFTAMDRRFGLAWRQGDGRPFALHRKLRRWREELAEFDADALRRAYRATTGHDRLEPPTLAEFSALARRPMAERKGRPRRDNPSVALAELARAHAILRGDTVALDDLPALRLADGTILKPRTAA